MVHQAPAALQAFEERLVATQEVRRHERRAPSIELTSLAAQVLRRTSAALSELEQSLSAASLSAAQGVQEVYTAVCGEAPTAGR